MAVVSKKYTHEDPYVDREFNSIIDQINRHFQSKILDVGQIPRGLNAYNIPMDVSSSRAKDTTYENARDKDQGLWVWVQVTLDCTGGIGATAKVELKVGYTSPSLVIAKEERSDGETSETTLIAWVPNRYQYQLTTTVTNSGTVTVDSWIEMDWSH